MLGKMWLAVRSDKLIDVKNQLAQLLGVNCEVVLSHVSYYSGITLFEIDERKTTKDKSTRNIECSYVEEVIAQALLQPSSEEPFSFLKSLHKVAAREQFNHLNSLLYINKWEK